MLIPRRYASHKKVISIRKIKKKKKKKNCNYTITLYAFVGLFSIKLFIT
jgi:hypothetical protein